MPDKPVNQPLNFPVLLLRNNNLARLYQHCNFLLNLEKQLLSFLDKPLNTHCKVANYASSTITLLCDSPAWAAKLRYNTPEILNYLRTNCNLHSLKTIRIKVHFPAVPKRIIKPIKRLKLSGSTVDYLSHVASTIGDEELRNSLLKIAKQK